VGWNNSRNSADIYSCFTVQKNASKCVRVRQSASKCVRVRRGATRRHNHSHHDDDGMVATTTTLFEAPKSLSLVLIYRRKLLILTGVTC
jgi:hypothetical protein